MSVERADQLVRVLAVAVPHALDPIVLQGGGALELAARQVDAAQGVERAERLRGVGGQSPLEDVEHLAVGGLGRLVALLVQLVEAQPQQQVEGAGVLKSVVAAGDLQGGAKEGLGFGQAPLGL